MKAEFVILTRIVGSDVWQREASSEAFLFREDAESVAATLERVNEEGKRLEYKVVERWR